MIKGALFYTKEDLQINRTYAESLIQAASDRHISLELHDPLEALSLGVFPAADFRFAINRSRSYELSLLLELNGLRVFNNSQITLLGNHKLAAYRHAQKLLVEIAPVYTSWQHNGHIISKPISGHGGQGVVLLDNDNPSLPAQSPRLQQQFVAELAGDVRFYVLGGEIIAAVLRKAPPHSILSNFTKGGSIEPFPFDRSHARLVARLLEGLDADYVGVDFLLKKDGSLLFGELEDAVGSRMLSALGANDTPRLLISHIAKQFSSEGR